MAACNGYVVVGKFLLSQSVDVNVVDNDSWTPCHHAAFWKQVSECIFLSFSISRYSLSVALEPPHAMTSTRNSSGDEIANVNFLYDDIVDALKIQWTLA